jgi:hypothetical protein
MIKDFESQLSDHERKLKEFEIQNDSLDREIEGLLDHCNVTEHQLTTYVTSPEHFTNDQWETMKAERKKLDDALALKLACITDLKKKKKAQDDRLVAPHWLFVR